MFRSDKNSSRQKNINYLGKFELSLKPTLCKINVPAIAMVTIVLRSVGGDHFAHIAMTHGNVTPRNNPWTMRIPTSPYT